jgi:membrane associated rhomboid family serine protease
MRRKAMTWGLGAIIVLGFCFQMGVAANHGARGIAILTQTVDEYVLLDSGAAYGGMDTRHEAWRLVDSIFLHAGIIHLAVNLLALASIGELLEGLFGAPLLLLSFIVGGVAASFITLLLPDSQGMVYVGASGAIFSIAGTLIVGLQREWRKERARWSARLSSRLAGCLVFNLVLGLIVSAIAAWSGLSFMIANGAHVAGLATGAVIGFLPIRVRRNQTTERMMRLFDPPPPPPEIPPPTQPYDG